MEAKSLMDTLVHCKRMGNLLDEAMDLTRQLAEAIDRNDQVSVEMLIAMRREPVEQLTRTDETIQTHVETLQPKEDALRLAELLDGMPAQQPEEQRLADQIAANKRRLKQVIDLDQIVNRKLAKEKTIYQ